MKPTQTLPEKYALAWSVDLKKNMRLNIILQIAGLCWMVLSGWLLALIVNWLRPEFFLSFQTGLSFNMLLILLLLIAVMALAIVLHELAHGLFFWLFARHRPEFGIGPGYAFAAMPDWFYPRGQYLVIALAPLVLLTLVGLTASIFAPQPWLNWLLIGMLINCGGAIGDMYIGWRVAHEEHSVLVKDSGDGFQLYRKTA
jgi:hypothetical protein